MINKYKGTFSINRIEYHTGCEYIDYIKVPDFRTVDINRIVKNINCFGRKRFLDELIIDCLYKEVPEIQQHLHIDYYSGFNNHIINENYCLIMRTLKNLEYIDENGKLTFSGLFAFKFNDYEELRQKIIYDEIMEMYHNQDDKKILIKNGLLKQKYLRVGQRLRGDYYRNVNNLYY